MHDRCRASLPDQGLHWPVTSDRRGAQVTHLRDSAPRVHRFQVARGVVFERHCLPPSSHLPRMPVRLYCVGSAHASFITTRKCVNLGIFNGLFTHDKSFSFVLIQVSHENRFDV